MEAVVQRNVNSRGVLNIDFYDGYVFKFLQELAASGGERDSGLYQYYSLRLERRLGGLLDYEGALAAYLLSEFPSTTKYVHVGIGIGTTTTLLAAMGRDATGIEGDKRRAAAAQRLRQSICQPWPDIKSRYTLVEGYFPDVIDTGKVPLGPDTVVFFTNFVGGPPDPVVVDRVIESLRLFGHAIIEMRMFVKTRELPEERAELLSTLVGQGYSDEGSILTTVAATHYRRFRTK